MKILIVDDESAIRDSLGLILRYEHHDVLTAPEGKAALAQVEAHPDLDLVFLDIKMPGRDGLEVLGDLLAVRPDLAVIVISGHATFETAVEATKRGAFDFIEKPLDREVVLLKVRKARDLQRLSRENAVLRHRLSDTAGRMLGESVAMKHLRDVVAKVAPTPARVLIQGENGSGKELVARLVHEMSPRANGPFVAVNCGAIPRELIESTLFGHEKGAFTGAVERQKGKFEQADGGTLFLDEVGDMPLEAQTKVLRVLEDQFLTRVGGGGVQIKVDVRVVAATNKDLRKAVADGLFREDLYYRLAVVPVDVPPLRERRSDVAMLAKAFLAEAAKAHGRSPAPEFTPRALELLSGQAWPGNVRQLKNLVERALILLDGDVYDAPEVEGLLGPSSPAVKPSPEGLDLFSTCKTFDEFKDLSEKLFLQHKLAENEWNVKRTAEALGMQRSHLYKKIERYGLK
ncbi:MAG: sigma-54-dependent Fis family transcriptional regulator [Planctomycetes bacterium]|nr:sigma-54-dependent Fis family transcriptional regulator [Planctomycetota bacterium]